MTLAKTYPGSDKITEDRDIIEIFRNELTEHYYRIKFWDIFRLRKTLRHIDVSKKTKDYIDDAIEACLGSL